jgi:pantothenate kinase
VAEIAEAHGRPRLRRLIGITGAPGSGKSTYAARLAAELGRGAVVLPMDGFHLPQARLVELGLRERMGAPETFDVDGFVAVLAALRVPATAVVPAPLFDRSVEEAVPGALRIGPGIHTVFVEGNYLLHDRDGWERVAPLLDEVLFLRIDEALRRDRLIARHIAFGKTADAAAAWALGPDEQNAVLVSATAPLADRIVALD